MSSALVILLTLLCAPGAVVLLSCLIVSGFLFWAYTGILLLRALGRAFR